MKAFMQAVLARVMGHINGRDCRHVPGDVFGNELLNLDFLQQVGVQFSLPDCRRTRVFFMLGPCAYAFRFARRPSSFCDKRRPFPCALWWSWYLHPVSRTSPRSSYDNPRFAHAPGSGLGTSRLFAPSRWTFLRISSTR